MNNAPNFASILDEVVTEVARPKPAPVGTYICVVGQFDDTTQKRGDNAPFGQFPLRPISALEDVDQEELNESGGLDGKTFYRSFWANEIYKLDEFFEHCGLDLSKPASRRARIAEVTNSQVLVVIKHVPRKNDDSIIDAQVARTAPAE